MDIIMGILVVLHIIGFGAVFGSSLAQLPNVKEGTAHITAGVIHGLNTMFVTGLLLGAMKYMMHDPASGVPAVDNVKITLKMAVLIVMVVIALKYRKVQPVSAGVLGTVAGLGVLNVALAVLWH